MEAWCDRQGKSQASVRFLYDGQRVQPTQTPQELEMEEGDALDVMMEQVRRHLVVMYKTNMSRLGDRKKRRVSYNESISQI